MRFRLANPDYLHRSTPGIAQQIILTILQATPPKQPSLLGMFDLIEADLLRALPGFCFIVRRSSLIRSNNTSAGSSGLTSARREYP